MNPLRVQTFMNKIASIVNINNNLIYSDKKIKINRTLLNSVLYPLTISLSPSDRSKGARWVSIMKRIIKMAMWQ